MALPAAGPATRDAVKAHLGGSYTDGDATDDDAIDLCVKAVNAAVRGFRVVQLADGEADWSGDQLQGIVLGSTLLAARLFRRRNSPDGVVAFAGDSPLYVQRMDPDVALLLQLGAHAAPGVG